MYVIKKKIMIDKSFFVMNLGGQCHTESALDD